MTNFNSKEKENNLKEQISTLLYKTLSYAYCDNCDNNDKECDCNRKDQEWALSKNISDQLAIKIMELIKENKK